ncbi:MAG: hypothetical protein ACP5HG_07165 [Anaerolineae bacterium]
MVLRTLLQTLLDSDPARLRVIARQWNITLKATRKADMAHELADTLASGEVINDRLDQLTPDQRAALDDLLRRGGAIPWAIFTREWGEVRTLGAGRVEREELWHEPVSPAEALWYMGLVQRAFDGRADHSVEMAFIPEELRLYMPTPSPVERAVPPEAPPPPQQMPGRESLADDLVTAWAMRYLPEDLRQPLRTQLHPPAEERLSLVERLSLEQGWLREHDDDLKPAASAILEWLQADSWDQWSTLSEAWMISEGWNDLAHVPGLGPDPTQGWRYAPQATRRAFLDVLAACQPDTWYNLDAFVAYVKTHATDFLRPDGDYETWAPRDAETDKPLRGFEVWEAVEGRLIVYLITAPLSWLGLVDLGAPHGDATPTAFRLSTAGAALVGSASPPTLEEPASVTVHPTGVCSVPARRRYERFQLSRIADPLPSADASVDAYRYRLTTSSLGRARQQRIPLERIITFLKEAAGVSELPAGLERAVQQAYQKQLGAALKRRWLLRVSDPQILQIPAILDLIDERLAPDLVSIRDDVERERLDEVLADSGILTEVEDG